MALYFSLYVVIIGSHLFFRRFDWWHTDVDSARYMLSALIQSEAAIVALVVTLSLVAVQLAAQSYSARVIEVFRKASDLWILMGIYGIAIFYGLGVLKMIENPLVGRQSNLEGQIAFSYYLGVFAFVALVPYILKIFDMLNPVKLINILKEDITQENILAGNKDGKRYSLQPIIEIINGALERYDYEIFDIGLDRISECAYFIIKNNTFKNSERLNVLNVSNYFFINLVIVGKLAVNRKDEKAAIDVIDTMQEIAKTLVEQDLDTMTADYFEDIGILAAGNDMENVVVKIIHSLEKIGFSTIDYELFHSVEHVVGSFEKLQDNILRVDFVDATRELICSLGKIGEHLTQNKQRPDITWKVISCLNDLKIPAFELGIAETLISSFRGIAVIHESDFINQIISNLLSIQELAYEIFNEVADEATQQIIIYLKIIGQCSIRNPNLKNASIKVIDSLKDAGINAIEHNTDASYLSPSYLGQLGDTTIEEKQYELTELIITRLNEIRRMAQEYRSSQTEEIAVEEINKLTKALKPELLRCLAEYKLMDKTFHERYKMDFDKLKMKQVVKKSNHSFKVEEDYCDWELALDGIKTITKELNKLAKYS